MKKLLLILLFLPLLFSCGEKKDDNKSEKQKDNIQNHMPDNICDIKAEFILTAEELETELKKDRERTDKKYQGKVIQITGDISTWGTSEGKPTIQLIKSLMFNFATEKIDDMNISDYAHTLPKRMTSNGKCRYITIKGIYNNGSSIFPKEERRSGGYEDDVLTSFLKCCVVKE